MLDTQSQNHPSTAAPLVRSESRGACAKSPSEGASRIREEHAWRSFRVDKPSADEFTLHVANSLATLRFWKIAGNPNKTKQDVVRTAKTGLKVPCGLGPSKTRHSLPGSHLQSICFYFMWLKWHVWFIFHSLKIGSMTVGGSTCQKNALCRWGGSGWESNVCLLFAMPSGK